MSRLNPLNLKQVRPVAWKGSSGADKRGHAIFENQAWAYRAALRALANYQKKGHLRTLRTLTSRWAPASDTLGSIPGRAQNDPGDYARFIGSRTGLVVDHLIDPIFDRYQIRPGREGALREIVRAMAIYENGHQFHFDEAAYAEGVRLFEEG